MKHITWLLLFSLLTIQCGYRPAGRGKNLPAAAKTVAIAQFKNDTSNLLAERFVSAAITEAFIRRSRLRLSQDMNQADLLLEGGISAFETSPVAYTNRGAVKLVNLRIVVHIRLIDMKKNELFYEGNGLVFRDTYETDADDFFSQEPAVLDKIAAKFASSIVTSILDDF